MNHARITLHAVSAQLVAQAQRPAQPYEGQENCRNCAHRAPSATVGNCRVCGSLSRWAPRATMGRQ